MKDIIESCYSTNNRQLRNKIHLFKSVSRQAVFFLKKISIYSGQLSFFSPWTAWPAATPDEIINRFFIWFFRQNNREAAIIELIC